MKSLVKLEVHNAWGFLPMSSIKSTLQTNQPTLRTLSLTGTFYLLKETCPILQSLSLESLTLAKCKVLDQTSFSNFLRSQGNLRHLCLRDLKLNSALFPGVSGLRKLSRLVFHDCLVDESSSGGLIQFSSAKSIEILEIVQRKHHEDGIHWAPLFSTPGKDTLKELKVWVKYAGAWFELLAENCGSLEKLYILEAGPAFGSPLLLHYLWELSTLKELCLVRCVLDDKDFCKGMLSLGAKTLSDLQSKTNMSQILDVAIFNV
jgi:hypothetical protein